MFSEKSGTSSQGHTHAADGFKLTPFEHDIVHLASQSFTNQEIAEKFDAITENEVEFEIGSLVEKLDLLDRKELIALFIQGKLD